jgi:hypothetical protein
MPELRWLAWGIVAGVLAPFGGAQNTFTNPLLSSGPDPWIVTRDGYYYFTCSTGNNLTIRKTRHLAELAQAKPHVVRSGRRSFASFAASGTSTSRPTRART